MAEPEYTPLDVQLSDAELEQLPPAALRLMVRKLLNHMTKQDERIKALEAEVSQLRAKLGQDSSYQENTPKPDKGKPGGHKGHRQQLMSPTKTAVVHPAPAAARRLPICGPTTPTSTSSCPRS